MLVFFEDTACEIAYGDVLLTYPALEIVPRGFIPLRAVPIHKTS